MIKNKGLGVEAGMSGLSISSRQKQGQPDSRQTTKGPSNLDLLPPLPPNADFSRTLSRQRDTPEQTNKSMAATTQQTQPDAGQQKMDPLSKVKNATGGILSRATRSKSIRGRKNKPPVPETATPSLPQNNGPSSPIKADTPVEQLQQREQRPRPESPQLSTETMPHLTARPTTSSKNSFNPGNSHFFTKVKAQGHNFGFHSEKTAKAVAEKGQKAWAKFKTKNFKTGGNVNGNSAGPDRKRIKVSKPPIDVFSLPLRESVLGTKVAKEREDLNLFAYWLPAIAFRCIEFLNVHGPTEVGIYRIPGSTAVVDELKLDFIQCYDVDLLENPPVDVHTVSSLLKAWFRSLSEPIVPVAVQKSMFERCKGIIDQELPPKEFIDEISTLPPYNYYLLKALFAHLRDVNQASEINKMNLANLGMVFCSCLRIDRFIFNWLVTGWAECWNGCVGEMDEYERILATAKPPSTNVSIRDGDSLSSRSPQPSPRLPTPHSNGSHAPPRLVPASPSAESHASGPQSGKQPGSPALISTSSPGYAPSSPGYSSQAQPSPAYYSTSSTNNDSGTNSRRPSTTIAEPPTPMYSFPPPSFSGPPAPPNSAAILSKPMTLPPYKAPVELPASEPSPKKQTQQQQPQQRVTPATPERSMDSWLGNGEQRSPKYELTRIDTAKASLAPLLPEIAPISPLMGSAGDGEATKA